MKKTILCLLALVANINLLQSQDLVGRVRLTSTQWQPGQTQRIILDIENIGNQRAGSSTAKYYISRNNSLVGATQIGSDGVSSMAAGEDDDERHNYRVPSNYAGVYYIIAVVDANNSVTETNENNNLSSKMVTIGSINLPDLTGSLSRTSSILTAGEQARIALDIENIGTASSSSCQVYYYLSSNPSLAGATYLGLDGISSQSAGTDDDEAHFFTVDANLSGTYYILAKIDYFNTVIESNENNNLITKTVTINNPGICEARDYIPSWDWKGQHYTVYIPSHPGGLTIESPWYSYFKPNDNINTFTQENIKDFDEENGWVLIQQDFGTPLRAVNDPYFLLYNRYSGIFRYFVAISEVEGTANSAAISLSFDNSKNSQISRHMDGQLMTSREDFSPTEAVAPIRVSNSYVFDPPTYWMHADFYTTYDPCVCDDTGQIKFSADLISDASLEFSTTGEGIFPDISNIGKIGQNGKVSLFKALETGVNDATKTYKTFKGAADAVSGVAKFFKGHPVLAIAGGGIILTRGITSFSSALKKGSSSSQQALPLVFNVDFKSEGSITWTNPHAEAFINVPGSQEVAASLVQYDNPVGIISMHRTPVFDRALGFYPSGFGAVKFKLKDDISYSLNPYSNLDLIDIKAAVVIEAREVDRYFDNSDALDFQFIGYEEDSDGRKTARWVSDFHDLECLKELTVEGYTGIWGTQYNTMENVKIGLKILVELDSKDNTHESFFMESYIGDITDSEYTFHDDPYYWVNTGINCGRTVEPVSAGGLCDGFARGASRNDPISIGSINKLVSYSDTRNPYSTAKEYGNFHSSRSTKDVFYKFRVDQRVTVEINTCGSAINDTYLSLLDSNGSRIAWNDTDLGSPCGNTRLARITRTLNPGTYYVVTEPVNSSTRGNITTEITTNPCTLCLSLSREQTTEDSSYKLFPNEVETTFTIASTSGSKEVLEVSVTSLSGIESHYYKTSGQEKSFNIDISDLKAGIYTVKVHGNKTSFTRMIVKK